MKILLLEDDINLHESLKAYLELENFEVSSAFNANDIYDQTFNNRYDLYIFDVNLNDNEDGFDILKNLKDSGDLTPTIYITALTDIKSLSKGFECGADDYIKKPFEPEELIIRIKSKYIKNEIINYKNLIYNKVTKELQKDNKMIILSEILSNLFHELICNKEKIVSNEILLDILENPNPNALRVNLSKLKSKLSLDIKNIRNVGYILEEL